MGSVPEAWACLRCAEPLSGVPDAEGMVACVNGHRVYSGYVAEAESLRPRLRWLDERIASGDPAPDPETARAGGIWPPTAGPQDLAAPQTSAGRGPGGPGVQVLLLGLGAGLLIVAGVVFTAVNWERLGAAGQVTVMGLATMGFGLAAVRLTARLPSTAEALAVVAFGLAGVDVVAAPALGLVPEDWLAASQAYLAGVTCIGAVLFVWLGQRFTLRAWLWLGWSALAVGAGLVTWYLALGPADSDNPWAALSVAIVSLATVGLWTAPRVVRRCAAQVGEMSIAAGIALALAAAAWLSWSADLDGAAIWGITGTTLVTAAAACLAWIRIPDGPASQASGLAAAGLLGVSVGMLTLLPADATAQANSSSSAEAPWVALVAGLAGVVVLAALERAGHARAGLLAAAALWTTWGWARLVISPPDTSLDPVLVQLAVLLWVASLTWYVMAARGVEPLLAWAAAPAGLLAWLAWRPNASWVSDEFLARPESWSVPFAALLLVAGILWHRRGSGGSLGWLGPAVTVALLPSAFFCWRAPWVDDWTPQTVTEGLVRLMAVLGASTALLVVGVRLRLAGLVIPASIALIVTASAQVWGGLSSLPRWLALGAVGAILFVLGARIEWLRRTGRGARDFVGSLR